MNQVKLRDTDQKIAASVNDPLIRTRRGTDRHEKWKCEYLSILDFVTEDGS
ncbi:hypothetical protein VD0002_g1320 [Verticillium dahliae]|nr:hypothetical protein VD0002_g1320 [Verticillium dahliae]